MEQYKSNSNSSREKESEKQAPKKKNIEKVTKKDVVALANKLHLDTIYFLKGDE